jgi:hypothetical protein
MLVVLATLGVASIGPDDGPYASDLLMQKGLRIGLALGSGLFVVLLGVLTAQCSRIGAPDRDRRLAAYRLAGATPRDVVRIASFETAIAAGFGGILGAAVYLAGRPTLDAATTRVGSYTREVPIGNDTVRFEEVHGQVHLLPTDVMANWWLLALAIVFLPQLIAGLTVVALRAVVTTPFGVVRRAEVTPPRWTPAVLFVVGAVSLGSFSGVRDALGITQDLNKFGTLFVLTATALTGIGLVSGVAVIAKHVGLLVAARTQSTSLLIAGRRLSAAPFSASRTNAVLLLVVLAGGFVQGLREFLLITTSQEADHFYSTTIRFVNGALAVGVCLAAVGVLVNTAERVVTNRRTLSSLVASGVPRRVLRTSLMFESLLPLLVCIPAAAITGVFAARGAFGTVDRRSLGTVDQETIVIVPVPIPWLSIFILCVAALGAVALMTSFALRFLSPSTDIAELRAAS